MPNSPRGWRHRGGGRHAVRPWRGTTPDRLPVLGAHDFSFRSHFSPHETSTSSSFSLPKPPLRVADHQNPTWPLSRGVAPPPPPPLSARSRMFYSHQLLARKAPLGQIWCASSSLQSARPNRLVAALIFSFPWTPTCRDALLCDFPTSCA